MIDTRDLWINTKRESLITAIGAVDVVVINEVEARALAKRGSLLNAARWILDVGPEVVIIKCGEYGSVMVSDTTYFTAPAYPLELVKDPTGAGDSFAGGFLGYLDKAGEVTLQTMKRAMIQGSAAASFTIQEFGVDRLRSLTPEDIIKRYRELYQFTQFED